MRPIKLKMQAFGPYAGTEVIDFSSLGNRTMFVISGKTGAGKTTIFDGISYAIYGKASGEDRNGPELRSQFASDDLNTEVSLQFSLRGKSYFIKRSPQQERKKERGDGYRIVGATAELYQYDEHGEQQLLAANVRDVEEKIKEIMLIDSNQFRQILMIPQGEFRKLLTSDSKEKEAILQRLFHTEIYKRVEDKLKEEATALKKSVEKQMEDRNLLIRKITALYNEELQEYLANGSENDVLIFPLLEDEIDQMKEQLEVVSKEVNDKTKDKELLSQKLYDAETILKQMQSRDELAARKIELEGQKDQVAMKERVIELANKAAILAKQDELCHRLNNEKKALLKDAENREARIAELKVLLQQREEAWLKEKDREGERKAAQETIHSLNQIKEEVKSFALLEQEVLKLENELKQLKQQQSSEEERVKLLDAKLKILQEEKSSLEKTELLLIENERKLEKLETELTLLMKYEQQLERYKENSSLLETKKGIFGQAQARLEDAKLLVTELENRWLHGQAANLASQLHDGESCPVCGSIAHPNPATGSGAELPNEDDLKAAKAQVVSLEREKTTAETAFLDSQSRTNALQDAIEELLSDIVKVRNDFSKEMVEPLKNQLLDKRMTTKQEQVRLSENKQKLEKITQELEDVEKQKESIINMVVKLTETVNEASITFTENKTKLEGLKVRIPEELRDYRQFEDKLMAAVRKQDLLQQQFELANREFQVTKERFASEESGLLTVRKHAEDKEKELNVEREAFVTQMKEQGFSDYKQFDAAKKSAGEIQQLENEIRAYGEELRSVSDRYQELSAALKDVQVPDMEGLKLALQKVQEQITTLNNTYTNLLIKKRDNDEIRDSILRINDEMKNLEERYKLVGELYDIARGQNASKITFERYVLAAFLDDILLEANDRLLKMTSGRYSMHRKKDRAKGNAQSGLELLVFDQYTGQERHVKTLSGGESFKAALSLALGLADVVQNYAGGVSLETMFIDEGFGTLDPESLDQAIEALIDIQSSGRLVGIISHVPELRERIDARLIVTATQVGSTTEFHLLNG
ncbi:AAA family ATPase [Robertmurraya kyonggiensis]|uniref:Nuclease SbcCD subunit C n=1 Tax=Robertmurraya kyonggiensis TaxID=1037680 RepID=A0A4U1D8L7_9BACI|nr:AAA family ATPase [Robertmurraya kyonggiensis]TKC18784.1 SMC family ATPase [Robertmurraya kyonggiensis]